MIRSMRTFAGLALGLLLAAGALAKPPTPLLWKATRGAETIYLLGSLHILQPADYPLSADVGNAYRAAARVVFEVPPAQMSPWAMLGPIAKLGMYGDPAQSLQKDLPPATWNKLAAYATKNGMALWTLKRMRPWMASATIMAMESKKLGYDPDRGLDKHFMDRTAADAKPTAGFETAQQQLHILAGAPIADQVRDLTKMVDDLPNFSKKLGQLHAIWRDGDASGLYREASAEFKNSPVTRQRMLDDRNRAWVPKLDEIAGQTHGPVLVIVGALHLLGPTGLVQLLRKDGYRLERVCTGCTNLH